MKKILFALCLCASVVLISGCVSAHKRSSSTETIRDFVARTNNAGEVVAVLAHEEIRTDVYRDGGGALFADPKASELRTRHENQTKLGGGSTLTVGEFASSMSTNAAPFVTSVGGAAGQMGSAFTGSGAGVKAGSQVVTNLLK